MPETTHLKEGFISTRTAARILGCTTSAVRLMAQSGRLATTNQNGKRKHMQVLLSEVQGVAADRSYRAAELLSKQVKVTQRLEAEVLRRTTAVKVAAEVPVLQPVFADELRAERKPVRQSSPASVLRATHERLDRIELRLDRLLQMWEGE